MQTDYNFAKKIVDSRILEYFLNSMLDLKLTLLDMLIYLLIPSVL
jgi:hypothetical protein